MQGGQSVKELTKGLSNIDHRKSTMEKMEKFQFGEEIKEEPSSNMKVSHEHSMFKEPPKSSFKPNKSVVLVDKSAKLAGEEGESERIENSLVEEADFENVEDEEAEEEDEDEEEEQFNKGMDLINLFIAILFIAVVLLENPIHKAFNLYESITDMFQQNNSNYDSMSSKSDLREFLNNVLIPQLYNDEENPYNVDLTPEERQNGTSHFYTNWNYFAGMKITIRKTLLGPNDDEQNKYVIPMEREENYQSPIKKFSFEDTKTYGDFVHSSSGGYQNAGGYQIYFPTNWTVIQANEVLTQLQTLNFFDEGFVSLAFELIFYNANDETSAYVADWFLIQNAGNLRRGEEVVGFFPQAYDSYHNNDVRVICGLLCQGLYILCFLYSLIKMFMMIYLHGSELITRGKLEAPWYDYLDIIVLSLCLTSVIYWFKLIALKMNMFELPFSEKEFDYWTGHARDTIPYIRVSGFAIAFMGIRMVQTLNASFPAFGILFDTLRKAKTDIFFFLCMMMILMFGYIVTSHCLFGYWAMPFHTLGESALKLVQSMMGEIDYATMKEANTTMSLVIFVPFMLLFFFILLNMFMAIIMSIYGDLRNAKQRDTEAIAELIGQSASKLRKKWVNLLTCAPPSDMNTTKKNEDEISHDNIKEREDEDKKGPSIYENFCFNISQLCCQTKILRTKEEFEKDKNNMIKIIYEKKKQKKKERLEQEKDANIQFELIAQAVLYLMFITVFVLMLSNQLNIGDISSQGDKTAQAIRNIMTLGGDIDYDEDISHPRDVQPLIKKMTSALFYENYVFPKNEEKRVKAAEETQILFFFNPLVRITHRWFKLEPNPNSKTRGVIPKIRIADSISESSDTFDGEYTDDYTVNNRTHKYSSGKHTANRKGGFPFFLDYNLTKTEEIMNQMRDNNIVNIRTGLIVIESVSYCTNNGLYSYNLLTYTFTATGKVKVQVKAQSFMMQLYHGVREFRLIFEILYVIFIVYYVTIELIDWCGKWMDFTHEHYEKITKPDATASCWTKFLLFMEINPVGFGENSMLYCLLQLFIAFIRMIIRWIIRFLQTMFAYLTKDFFNFLDFCSLTMSISLIFTWIGLISNTINNPEYRGSEPDDKLTVFAERSSTFVFYAWISSINNLIIFFRILQYYNFSKKLSMLATVLDSGAKDIFFFFLMFALILFGFTVMGHLIFGKSAQGYATIFNSLTTIFTIIIGCLDAAELRRADPQMSIIYFLLIMILFFLILLNMFIAIIGAHHEEVVGESGEEEESALEANVLKKIIFIVKKKMYSVSKLVTEKTITEVPTEDLLIPHMLLRFSKNMPDMEEESALSERENMVQDKQIEEEKEEASAPIGISEPFYQPLELVEAMRPYAMHTIKDEEEAYENIVNGEDDINKPISLNVFSKKINDEKLSDFDKTNPNLWTFNLEQTLTKASKNSLLLSELYYKDHSAFINIPKKPEITSLAPLVGQFVMLNPEDLLRIHAWRNADIDLKLAYWQGMDIEHYNLSRRQGEIHYEGEDDQYASILLTSYHTEKHQTGESPKGSQAEYRRAQSPSLDASKLVIEQEKKEINIAAVQLKPILNKEEIKTDETLNEEKVNRMKDILKLDRYAGIATSDSEDAPGSAITYKKMIASRYYNFEAFNIVSETQVAYWHYCSKEEKYSLWFEQFNNKERTKLWNSLRFSKEHFIRLLGKQANGEVEVIKRMEHSVQNVIFLWNCCLYQVRDNRFEGLKGKAAELIQAMVYGDYSFVKKESGNQANKQKVYKRIGLYYGDLEERLQLWFPLSIQDKLEMLMNQNNFKEAEIMIMLIAVEEPRTTDLRMFDVTLERELDTRIFRKCILLSQLQALKYSLDMLIHRMTRLEKEDSDLYHFVVKMHEKINHFKKQGVILARDVKNRQRMNAKKQKK